jgi:hypothetical protein
VEYHGEQVVSKYYVGDGIGVPYNPDPDMIFEDLVHAYTVMRWLNATRSEPDPRGSAVFGFLDYCVFDFNTGQVASVYAMDLEPSDRPSGGSDDHPTDGA